MSASFSFLPAFSTSLCGQLPVPRAQRGRAVTREGRRAGGAEAAEAPPRQTSRTTPGTTSPAATGLLPPLPVATAAKLGSPASPRREGFAEHPRACRVGRATCPSTPFPSPPPTPPLPLPRPTVFLPSFLNGDRREASHKPSESKKWWWEQRNFGVVIPQIFLTHKS